MKSKVAEFFEKNRIVLTLIPVLIMMTVIFCMSAQTAAESLETSDGFVEIAIKVVSPDYEELPVEEQQEIHSNMTTVIRKIGHFVEYGALGFFAMLHADAVNMKKKLGKVWIWALGFCFVYACSDEIHQMFVSGRGPGVTDVIIDTSGAVVGIVAMQLLLSRERKKKNGK